MDDKHDVLWQLVEMSRNLGLPERDYVILGDGNTSARVDEKTFWIKASGAQLHGIQAGDFVEVATGEVLGMLQEGTLSDAEIARRLAAARVDPDVQSRPSIETTFHALALTLGEAQFVGHTHPTALVAVLCSKNVLQAIRGRLFTEEILYCGPAPAFVPYADPGFPLAREVLKAMQGYLTDYGQPPKVILLQNHGLIALGKTPKEVENITAMCVKAARVLLGTCLLGGPRFLSEWQVRRIQDRPDEGYRRDQVNE
jgi:rhamnose utilization protein RhaD (predicted bifunctional aldolase and dehydrogenase)